MAPLDRILMEGSISTQTPGQMSRTCYTLNHQLASGFLIRTPQMGFLEQYPQYQGRDLWITGESYGGVYVPSLSELLVTGPDQQLSEMIKGFMVGNPVMRCEDTLNLNTQLNIFYWHGLVSYYDLAKWNEKGCNAFAYTKDCLELYEEIYRAIGKEFQQTDPNQPSLDPDDLYENFCTGNGSLDFSSNLQGPNCIAVDTLAQNYLNQADVQAAIHAVPTNWTACADPPQLFYVESFPSMLPFYEKIFEKRSDFNILVYSGDVDVHTVPFPFTQRCLSYLQRPITDTWKPWFVNEATAGYWEVHDRFTYATVKGGGHEAPQYQTLNAFNLFSRFLQNQSLAVPDNNSAPQRTYSRHQRSGDVLRAMFARGQTRL
eukprot:TRINITY_DN433_c0_g2_i1.p1 TRINITY_DN433_c0_g2~~TRINITY_DN433_c0_g2_i1.p1  ORF type:complete len:373 (-),score=42.52 TRINITY_DN433_c0_g2_i1:45-1163(-)